LTLPPELDRSTPRHVALSKLGRFLSILAIGLLVAAPVVGAALYSAMTRNSERRAEGISASAEIVEIHRPRSDDGRWVETYAFVVDGRTFHGTRRVGVTEAQKSTVGQPVAIRFNATDPKDNWADDGRSGDGSVVVAPIVAASLALGGLAILSQLRRQTTLLSYGRGTIARVTAVRQRGGSTHGGKHWRVTYTYTLLSGAIRTTALEVDRRPPAVGSDMVVVYDPDRPSRRARYPMALVKCAAPF
jgi:hypothetical protein